MKKLILGLGLCLIGFFAQAQNGLEQLIVEKYYVANAADAAGSLGTLPLGSVTYRIYADMLPGYKFQMAYGSASHNLLINTTTSFFNNEDRGATTPTYTKAQASQNTVMLDSWVSVGSGCSGGNMGVLKSEDDGVATVVNANGLLQNTDPSIGMPLTVQDGLIAGAAQSVTFVGISAAQLAVFDATSQYGNSFSVTNGSWASLSTGVPGPTASNRVLIAQMTTDGVFHYEVNIQIKTPSGDIEKYVTSNPLTSEITIPSLVGTYGGVNPNVYAITGGGSYCQSVGGSPIGISNSQLGVSYTLIKNGVPTSTIVAGTGSAISFGNQLAGTFTVTGYANNTVPTINTVVTPMTGSAVNTEIPSVTPTFTALGPYCIGSVPGDLLPASLNGITGTWSPSVINTALTGASTYTFTPTAGLCASTVTMSVIVNPMITPTFSALGPYCQGATPGTLVLTSLNGITGTWTPSTISTATAGTTVYTFTPAIGQCATTTTKNVVVNSNVIPTLIALGPYCQGETPGVLLPASLNNISGTWAPAAISTANAGTTVYTFTPVTGQCATIATIDVLVFERVVPTFTALGPYNIGETPGTLPTISNNSVKGSWVPEIISTVAAGTIVYTFTPDPGECATSATMEVIVGGSANKTLNVKLYFEGIYNTGTGVMNQAIGLSGPEFGAGIADQITVELHQSTSPYATAFTYSNINLNTNGTLAINTLSGSITGSYYIVIKHRNSIETWSATPISFGGGIISYDFSTSDTQAYGSNLKLTGSVFAIWGGDASQDGAIDGTDMAAIDNASTITLAGYNPEDVNGDGVVDGSDMALIDNNSTATIVTLRP
jgi:hypothetical protein